MGAKFSGGGATVFYDDGIKTAASGTTGTQRDEFEAAIKSITSSTTVGAVFLYDTSQDSDGGKWRKGNRCKGLSWFDEPTLPAGTGANQWNSATRSARSEFPAMALIVADNHATGASRTVTIYDLDDPAMPLWLQFTANTNSWLAEGNIATGDADMSAITALNGRVCVAVNDTYGGLFIFDFASDSGTRLYTSQVIYNAGIGLRNSDKTIHTPATQSVLANRVSNDVAATVLEGAEIGALGLPIPTVAVATAGGVSVIHPNGDVYDQTHTVASDNKSFACFWDNKGGLYWSTRDISSAGVYFLYQQNPLFADSSAITGVQLVTSTGSEVANAYPYFLASAAPYVKSMTSSGDNKIAVGTTNGLSLYKVNAGNFNEGAVAYITADYNTGYMVGDIKFAGLAGNGTANEEREDRCVRGLDLTETGTITSAAVATGAELYGYSGFSASTNYLGQNAAVSHWNFGTGDFSVMFWAKWSESSTNSQIMVDRGSTSGARFIVYDPYDSAKNSGAGASGGKPQFQVTDGSSAVNIKTTNSFDDGNWHQVVAVRRSSKIYIYVDGQDAQATSVASTQNLDNGSAVFRVGVNVSNTDPFTGSLALLRLSKTAPTPQQIKEIYDAEKPLFQANAKCLLQSTSGSPNIVHDLSYDKSTDLLSVSQYVLTDDAEGMQRFRGLEMVDMLDGKPAGSWSAGYTTKISTAGGVTAGFHGGTPGGVVVDLPALDVRAELNEGDDKLPDDGKLHFEGVTTDATQTVIASIPIELNETYTVNTTVNGHRYQSQGNDTCFTDIREFFYRGANTDIQNPPANIYKLENLGTSTMDVSYAANTTANTIEVKVTGVSGQRVVWKASVEVERISEKTYER